VVAEVGGAPESDQIYRITFDGSVNEEHGYVAMGGQADQVATVLKEHYADRISLAGGLAAAIAALSGPANGEQPDISASQLEVAVLDRERPHRKFRWLTGARLEALLAEARPAVAGPKHGDAAKQAAAKHDDTAKPAAAGTPDGESGGNDQPGDGTPG
jgi:proteasome alpha subunit